MRFPSILALLPVLAAAQPTMMERAEAKSMIQISDHSVNFFFCPNIPRKRLLLPPSLRFISLAANGIYAQGCVDALTSISDVCVRAAEDLGLSKSSLGLPSIWNQG